MNRRLIVSLVAAAICGQASAAFYVEDDSPVAIPLIAPIAKPEAMTVETRIEVGFHSESGTLGPKGRALMKTYSGEFLAADEIAVISYANGSATRQLQQSRLQSIRNWLLANGVPLQKIVLSSEGGKGIKDTVIVAMKRVEARSAPAQPSLQERLSAARLVQPSAVAVQPTSSHATSRPGNVITDDVKLVMAQRIVTLAKNKAVNAEDAINMLADLLKQDTRAAPAVATAAAVVEMPRTWTLSSEKTLRENIEEWAAAANWHAPTWLPSGVYRISYTSTVSGTFLDALRQVAEAVPNLDFEANRAKRTLTVKESRSR